jgi:hypothetical protein
MSDRYSNTGTIHSKILDDDIKGFIEESEIESLRSSATTGQVLHGMAYRPDKVAEYYLGNSNYAWKISLINNFENGIRDYYEGRSILIPAN